MKRTNTDCFLESKRRGICADLVTINDVDYIEIQVTHSSTGDDSFVYITPRQAIDFAQQLLEMCDD